MNLEVVATKEKFNSVGHCMETSAKGVARVIQGCMLFFAGIGGTIGNIIIYFGVGIAKLAGGKDKKEIVKETS